MKEPVQQDMFPAEVEANNVKERALAMRQASEGIRAQMEEAGVSAQDLIIPRLLLMQNTSEMVGEEKAKMGDIINSQSEAILGGVGKGVELVPLKLFKTILTYDVSGSQPKFLRQEPWLAVHDKPGFQIEGVENGVKVRYYKTYNVFCLVHDELVLGEAFPAIVGFKSTSFPAGKKIASHIFKMIAFGRMPYTETIVLSTKKEKKDTNTFGVFEIGQGKKVDKQFLPEIEKWIATLQSMTYKVDDEEQETSTTETKILEPEVITTTKVAEDGPY